MPKQPSTLQFTDWSGGINRTAARTRIKDTQAYWLENLQPIGNGQAFVVPSRGPTRASLTGTTIGPMYDAVIKVGGVETAYLLTIQQDGSIRAFNPVTFTYVVIAGPGTVTAKCRRTIWQDTHVLFGDPTTGYFSWDGTTVLHYPLALTGSVTLGSAIITLPSTAGLVPGMQISGPDLPTSPTVTIVSVDNPTQITVSANATNTVGAEALTVGAGAPSKVFDLAVFEGRVWLLVAPRALTFSAPGSFTDFTTISAAGTASIIDSVFQGQITRLLSALELLWLIGPSAVNAISNVQVAPIGASVVTTFSDTNIVTNVGTVLPDSANTFFRTFLFLSPYGIYAIVGATPQKLSDDLDGLFDGLIDVTGPNPSGTFTVHEVFLWAVLVTYNDPVLGPRPILLCFAKNAWFVASQGPITFVSSVVIPQTGRQQLWATDGTTLWQCFDDPETPITYTLQTKLWDFGAFTTWKQLTQAAMEFENRDAVVIDAQFFAETESRSLRQPQVSVTPSTLVFVGAGPITFVGTGPIIWVAGVGIQQAKGGCDAGGHYIGAKITGTSRPFVFVGLAMQIEPQGEWT